MINEKEGYLLYCSSANPIIIKLYYTGDGGNTFSFYSEITQISSYVKDFYISPNGKAYIVTDFRGNVTNTTMFESKDLANWEECQLDVNYNKTHYLCDTPVFYDSNNGFLFLWKQVNTVDRTFFFKTNDGGNNWEQFYRTLRGTMSGKNFVKMSIDAENEQIYLVDKAGKVYSINIK